MNNVQKILLIDDSTFARNIIRRSLGAGYQYIDAADGMSGLELYSLHRPELVILDLTMPGVNGMQVLEQLRRLDPQAHVIVCSADVQTSSHTRALELGASAFLNKPVTREALESAAQPLLEARGGGA